MREIPDPGYAGDLGAPDPTLTAALTAYDADATATGRYAAVLAALSSVRLVVPVVAVLGESEAGVDGLVRDKSADMAAVLLRRPDGDRALLAFTGVDALARWDPQARPVPVPTRTAAQATLQEGATTLLVDLAGPVQLAVAGEDLAALARGWQLVALGDGFGWIGPAAE